MKCPRCSKESAKVHSRYKKSFQELPIQGKKVTIIIKNRNMFCINENCKQYTFSEKKAIKKALQRVLVGRIEIPVTSQDVISKYTYLVSLSRREKIIKAKELRKLGYSFELISEKLLVSTTTAKKYCKLSDYEIPEEKHSIRDLEHRNAKAKVENKVNKVRELNLKGFSIEDISKVTGYSRSSIKKYLSDDFCVVHGQYGVSRHGLLSPFREEVISLRAKGYTYSKITDIIKLKGYTGSVDALRGFIAKEKRITKDLMFNTKSSELIDKKHIIKLLYKPLENVKSITVDQLNEVMKKYPIVNDLFKILAEFKVILSMKKPENIANWIDHVSKLKIAELDTFINGLKNDYESIVNAATFDYNNGLAEGSVNKLKTIKRIMYGRSSFELLRIKIIKLEYYRKRKKAQFQ